MCNSCLIFRIFIQPEGDRRFGPDYKIGRCCRRRGCQVKQSGKKRGSMGWVPFFFLWCIGLDQTQVNGRVTRFLHAVQTGNTTLPKADTNRHRHRKPLNHSAPRHRQGGQCQRYQSQAVRAKPRGPDHQRRISPDIGNQPPGKPRQHIRSRQFCQRQTDRQRNGPPPRSWHVVSPAKGRAPKQGQTRRHEKQRKGGHPRLIFRIDKKRVNDPVNRRGEIAAAGEPACPCGVGRPCQCSKQPENCNQSRHRDQRPTHRCMAKGRQSPKQQEQRIFLPRSGLRNSVHQLSKAHLPPFATGNTTRKRLMRRGSASRISNSVPLSCLMTSPRTGTRPASRNTSPPKVPISSSSSGSTN